MRRREFITLLGGAAATWPLAARAQQPQQMRRIGVLFAFAENEQKPNIAAFKQALGELGWSEGRNLRIDLRWGAGDNNRLRAYAKELIGMTPDVVVSTSTPGVAALRQETSTIPIVFLNAANTVGRGFVASLSHPGGNVTGFTNFEPAMGGKWLELLKEIAPQVARADAIFNPETHSGQYWQTMETAARTFAVELAKAPVRDAAEIERAVEALTREPNGGLLVMPDGFTTTHSERIVSLAARHRLPAVYPFRFFVASGGLISYGPNVLEEYRHAASYVDRILRGEKAADLPVQGPTKLELVINLKAANALGLTVPPTLLTRADEVIE